MSTTRYFDGTVSEPLNNYDQLPVISQGALTDPKDYRAGTELTAAVNVALTLGMPLLLTGEPGCGKSELARRIAWELGFPKNSKHETNQVLKYAVKSTTEAKDLFYTFDAVGRFHAVQTWKTQTDANLDNKAEKKHIGADNFIEYQALGLAILRAKGKKGQFPSGVLSESEHNKLPDQAHRSVVLIDEIDKAPRDVPNDILNEIEHMEFTIPELGGARIGIDNNDSAFKPIIIITSNSERDLPAAFLRRCVYYHVPFPPFNSDAQDDNGVTVEDIVTSRLGKRFTGWTTLQNDALSLCRYLRSDRSGLLKPPSLAEILCWLNFLADHADASKNSDGPLNHFSDTSILLAMKTTLLKTRDDQARASQLYQDWQQIPNN